MPLLRGKLDSRPRGGSPDISSQGGVDTNHMDTSADGKNSPAGLPQLRPRRICSGSGTGHIGPQLPDLPRHLSTQGRLADSLAVPTGWRRPQRRSSAHSGNHCSSVSIPMREPWGATSLGRFTRATAPFAKAAAFATITFIILTLAIGSLHLSLYERLPQEEAPALLTELGLLALSLTPAIIAGYSAGYLARAKGIATGALAAAIAAVILLGSLGIDSWSQHFVSIVLAALSGGCGELLALGHSDQAPN
jgi:hypothetical protein